MNMKTKALNTAGALRPGDLFKERMAHHKAHRDDLRKRAPVRLRESTRQMLEAVALGAIQKPDGSIDECATALKIAFMNPRPLVKVNPQPKPLRPGNAGATVRPIGPPTLVDDNPTAFRSTGGARPVTEVSNPELPVLEAGAATDLDHNRRRYKDCLDTIRAIQAAGSTPMFPRR